jgi:hypothetical protein
MGIACTAMITCLHTVADLLSRTYSRALGTHHNGLDKLAPSRSARRETSKFSLRLQGCCRSGLAARPVCRVRSRKERKRPSLLAEQLSLSHVFLHVYVIPKSLTSNVHSTRGTGLIHTSTVVPHASSKEKSTSPRHGRSIHLGDKPACNPPVTKKSDPVVNVLASDNR